MHPCYHRPSCIGKITFVRKRLDPHNSQISPSSNTLIAYKVTRSIEERAMSCTKRTRPDILNLQTFHCLKSHSRSILGGGLMTMAFAFHGEVLDHSLL